MKYIKKEIKRVYHKMEETLKDFKPNVSVYWVDFI